MSIKRTFFFGTNSVRFIEIPLYNIDVNKNVMLFNETVLNIIRNFIPHEVEPFDDRDPPWITSRIKKTINDKNLAFKRCLNCLIETSKQEYFPKIAKKLSDPNISSKPYWSILKSLAFRLFFMITNSLPILEKKLSFLIRSLLIPI